MCFDISALGTTHRNFPRSCLTEVTHDASCNSNSMFVVPRKVVRHAALRRMHHTSTKCLFVDLLTRRCLHKRWTREEDAALLPHNDVLVCHGGDVCPACDGDTVHDGYLRKAKRGHLGHVVEYATKVLLVREHLQTIVSCVKCS